MSDFKKLWTLSSAGLLVAGAALAQAPGELFPQPFLVEHRIVHTDESGDVFVGDPVVDYYGGSWIASVRADGSRLVLDLARREITEIRPAEGVYYALSFDRFAELRSEIARFEAGFPAEEEIASAAAPAEKAEAPSFDVTESPGGAPRGSRTLPKEAAGLLSSPGVRHLRVTLAKTAAAGGGDDAMDVWCDASVRLSPQAMTALERFELSVLGPPAWLRSKRTEPAAFLAAARRRAGGAFPIRTVRPLDLGAAGPERNGGALEDVALRLEKLDSFPLEMVAVPDGLRRAAHPMEAVVDFAGREEERERVMGRSTAGE